MFNQPSRLSLGFLLCFFLPRRPSLEEADVIQNQVVAQDFIGKRGSAVNVSTDRQLAVGACVTYLWYR